MPKKQAQKFQSSKNLQAVGKNTASLGDYQSAQNIQISPVTHIIIKNAHQHNLKNIDIAIPKRKLVVFTGLSGSGKSTLAMDTIYAEGQRRYVESLSTYARQFLGELKHPKVDKIEGLSPAIAIDQKTTSHNPRSTVATITEIYDYLRLLYARVGVAHCPICKKPLSSQSPEEIIENIIFEAIKYLFLELQPENIIFADAQSSKVSKTSGNAQGSIIPAKPGKYGFRFFLTGVVANQEKGAFADVFMELRREGFNLVLVDNKLVDLGSYLPTLDKNKKHTIEVITYTGVLDKSMLSQIWRAMVKKDKTLQNTTDMQRVRKVFLEVFRNLETGNEQGIEFQNKPQSRQLDNTHSKKASDQSVENSTPQSLLTQLRTDLMAMLQQALNVSPSFVRIVRILDDTPGIPDNPKILAKIDYSTQKYCHTCNVSVPDFEPRHFSFNSPAGACPVCTGLGFVQKIDADLLIDYDKTLAQGAIWPFAPKATKIPDPWGVMRTLFYTVVKQNNIPLNIAAGKLPKSKINILLYGDNKEYTFEVFQHGRMREYTKIWKGVANWLEQRYLQTNSEIVRQEIQKHMIEQPCEACHGARLKPESLAVTVDGLNIHELTSLSIKEFYEFIKDLPSRLEGHKTDIAKTIVRELKTRAEFLIDVGLGYLTLNRSANTLSGGEAQRVRLASQIGIGLTDVIYVLDEPSIGLHARDQHRLINTLKKLRDMGNTVLVVEHDEDTIKNADVVIDFGPKAGRNGGQIVSFGSPEQIAHNKNSVTGPYLAKTKTVHSELVKLAKQKAIPLQGKKYGAMSLRGVKTHNLKNITVDFPLGLFTVVTGVSGSGKSSLVMDTLLPAIKKSLGQKSKNRHANYESIFVKGPVKRVVAIDQTPIGRTPRSNPATYTGVFTDIRNLFAQTKLAKIHGFRPGHFSFNIPGGRCEACKGEGVIRVEMQFMPDVYVTCDVCGGKRYTKAVLQAKYKDKSIYDVLEMTVEEALEFFYNIPTIKHKLQVLNDIGLGYIKLGQPATTLSGGEAQRVKLAKELQRTGLAKTVYILDEPTTGLHFEDVVKLLAVIKRLVANGHTVIVIEHNLDFIREADYIIDLGPEGGDAGGNLIYAGPLSGIKNVKESITGRWV